MGCASKLKCFRWSLVNFFELFTLVESRNHSHNIAQLRMLAKCFFIRSFDLFLLVTLVTRNLVPADNFTLQSILFLNFKHFEKWFSLTICPNQCPNLWTFHLQFCLAEKVALGLHRHQYLYLWSNLDYNLTFLHFSRRCISKSSPPLGLAASFSMKNIKKMEVFCTILFQVLR